MHDNVVEDEIKYPIRRNAKADVKQGPVFRDFCAHNDRERGGNPKNHGEQIIFFQGIFMMHMVGFVPVPHDSMHDVFVCKPSDTFHS